AARPRGGREAQGRPRGRLRGHRCAVAGAARHPDHPGVGRPHPSAVHGRREPAPVRLGRRDRVDRRRRGVLRPRWTAGADHHAARAAAGRRHSGRHDPADRGPDRRHGAATALRLAHEPGKREAVFLKDRTPRHRCPMYENLLANVPTDLWIGGKWRKASDGARFDVIDPATENKVTSVASASVDDAKSAVDAASGAFEAWAGRKPRERGEILRKAYEVIMAQSERLGKLITLETGKALSDSRGEVAYAAEFFRWYAEEAVRAIGQLSRAPASGARIVVQHKPAGVAVLV